jgi:hypothetical protein
MRDPDLISMIYKAERACKSCRDRKQGCDKTLPQCLRCSSYVAPCLADQFWNGFVVSNNNQESCSL